MKERMKVPRQLMPEQPAQERAHNFEEVNLGYSAELAQQEAMRCLECAKPTCTDNCPVGVNVKEFVEKIVIGDFLGAAAKIREDNVLPAVTGRVCPQEDQCEGKCLLSKKVKPLGIGYLERFVADYEQRMGTHIVPSVPPTGKKVAVVGSGPSGLTVAGDLIQKGHKVRVFEALHEIGGVLVYGIPEFRLPKQIVREQIDYMREMGVEFETDVVVGRTVTIDELLEEEGFDAVYIGTGAGLPQFMNIPGEHLNGVYSANEFLTRINLMKAYKFPVYDEPMLDLQGKECGGDRRRQHGAGCDSLGVAPGSAQGVRDLSPQRRRDAGSRRRSAPRAAGGNRLPDADRARRVPFRRQRMADRRALRAHGTGRARCFRPQAAGADAGIGVRSAVVGGDHCDRHERESDCAEHHARSGHEQARIHSGQRRNAAHHAQRSIRRRRHRDRQRHGDSGDGRGTPRGEIDSRVSDDRRVVRRTGSQVSEQTPVVDSELSNHRLEPSLKADLKKRIRPRERRRQQRHQIFPVDGLPRALLIFRWQQPRGRLRFGPVTFPRIVHGATSTRELFRIRFVFPIC